MSADNVTPIRPEPPPRDRSFEALLDSMQAGINALLCAHAALVDPRIDQCEVLSAGRAQVHRTFREFTRLVNELEEWHMRTAAEKAAEK